MRQQSILCHKLVNRILWICKWILSHFDFVRRPLIGYSNRRSHRISISRAREYHMVDALFCKSKQYFIRYCLPLQNSSSPIWYILARSNRKPVSLRPVVTICNEKHFYKIVMRENLFAYPFVTQNRLLSVQNWILSTKPQESHQRPVENGCF